MHRAKTLFVYKVANETHSFYSYSIGLYCDPDTRAPMENFRKCNISPSKKRDRIKMEMKKSRKQQKYSHTESLPG